MMFDPTRWRRYISDNIPIYVHTDSACWFVPNNAGNRVLQGLDTSSDPVGLPAGVQRFLQRLPSPDVKAYDGRARVLRTEVLKEIWFHITNRCNLACTHCLFASSLKEADELPLANTMVLARAAAELGCRVFALTGGEPFVHRDFERIVDGLLAIPEAHVAVLTNGTRLRQRLADTAWDWDRFHLQVSMDGLKAHHDAIRGPGAFDQLIPELEWLRDRKIPYTLSMSVNARNIADMPEVIDLAARLGAGNVHFMWYFVRGRGQCDGFAPNDRLFEMLTKAMTRAEDTGIAIDNIEALKSQIFAPPGTIHDGTTAGWESVAVGPDGRLYPSAALVGMEELASDISEATGGLAGAWRRSPVLEQIRNTSISGTVSPFRFLLGGGDSDHSYTYHGTFVGHDPYLPLYEKTSLHLIARAAGHFPVDSDIPRLRLKMGDMAVSCGAHEDVALIHSNCLLAFAQTDSLTTVKNFYADAVGDQKKDILNPVCYYDDLIQHIPKAHRFRGYGCGSPVVDAGLTEGEYLVDLGSGSGVECFIAARQVGATGRVTGVDMLDPMLALAEKAHPHVARNLGYDNLDFRKGYLESLPVEPESADVVVSNCVMNLSVHKRQAFSEIFRALKPGGRLVVSDVVCETEPDAAVRNDETLRGECIAGAFTQTDLMGILEETGFRHIQLLKRFPYRTVKGHPFYSLTYRAVKPMASPSVSVIYRGPLATAITDSGTHLQPGRVQKIPRHDAEALGDSVFILDDTGGITNMALDNTCACCIIEPQSIQINETVPPSPTPAAPDPAKFRFGCMVCGEPLTYTAEASKTACHYCGQVFRTNAVCPAGHFVCDRCHQHDAIDIITHICLGTSERDMIALLERIRRHPGIPLHGPEHHALVPGIILATYRNLGGRVTEDMIRTAIRRGSTVAGGYCGFMGICGAAVGVGVGFSVILDSNPVKPEERQCVQTVTQQVLAEIGAVRAARCCQRDSWIALKTAAQLSEGLLPIPLSARTSFDCRQQSANKECIGVECPVMQARQQAYRPIKLAAR